MPNLDKTRDDRISETTEPLSSAERWIAGLASCALILLAAGLSLWPPTLRQFTPACTSDTSCHGLVHVVPTELTLLLGGVAALLAVVATTGRRMTGLTLPFDISAQMEAPELGRAAADLAEIDVGELVEPDASTTTGATTVTFPFFRTDTPDGRYDQHRVGPSVGDVNLDGRSLEVLPATSVPVDVLSALAANPEFPAVSVDDVRFVAKSRDLSDSPWIVSIDGDDGAIWKLSLGADGVDAVVRQLK